MTASGYMNEMLNGMKTTAERKSKARFWKPGFEC